MSSVLDSRNLPASDFSEEPTAGQASSKLNIAVVFTSIEATLSALKQAGTLAIQLNASITLIVPHVVPYPLPLNRPAIQAEFTERRFRVLAGHSGVDTIVKIYLCRDRDNALTTMLSSYGVIVIGHPKSWWPGWERRLAKKLRRAGHDVVLVRDSDDCNHAPALSGAAHLYPRFVPGLR